MTCAHGIDPYTRRCRHCGRSQRDIVFVRNQPPQDEGEKVIPNRHPVTDVPQIPLDVRGTYTGAPPDTAAASSPLDIELAGLRRALDASHTAIIRLSQRLEPIRTPKNKEVSEYATNDRGQTAIPTSVRSSTVTSIAMCTVVANGIHDRIVDIMETMEV